MMKKVLSLVLCLALLLSSVSGAQAELLLPMALRSIEEEAFLNDTSITGTVTLPSGVKNVGNNAFAGTDVFALWTPAGVKTIGNNVLANTDAVYAVVPSRTASVGSINVQYLLAYAGSPAQQWAQRSGTEFIDIVNVAWYDGFCYRRDASIEGYGLEVLFARNDDMGGEIRIPAQVDGIPVTAVGPHAFTSLDDVTAIEIPETAVLPGDRVNWPNVEITTYEVGSDVEVPDGMTELEFEFDHISMNPGEEIWLEPVNGIPEHEGGEEWKWESLDNSVATFKEDGTLVAGELGETAVVLTVFCEDGQVFYADASISVVEPMLEVEVDDEEFTVAPGVEFYPNWSYIDSSTYANPEGNWISDNEEAVKVGEDGQLIAVAPGEAYCTIVCKMGDLEAGATLRVVVYEPELVLNHHAIMAYTEHQYQLALESEIPADAVVTYASSNEEVLSVDENGLVTVLPMEEDADSVSAFVTVTVTFAKGGTVSEMCMFEVLPWRFRFRPWVTELAILPGEYVHCWPMLQTRYFSKDHDCYAMTMVVEDESIMAPTAEGWYSLYEGPNVNTFKQGTTNVTFKAWFNPPYAEESQLNYVEVTIPVTVCVPYMEAFIDRDELHFERVGHKDRLEFGYDSEVPITKQYFTSEDTSVATVDATGLVVAQGPGETTVTYHIEVNGIEATASIPVIVDGYKMTLNKTEASIQVGDRFILKPTVNAPEGAIVEYQFHVRNQAVIEVTENGYVTGLAAGTAVILCEAYVMGDPEDEPTACRAVCTVEVSEENARISLNYNYKELAEGESFTLVPTFHGEVVTDIAFDTDHPGLTSVDENGVVTMHGFCHDEYPVITVSAIVDGVPVQAYCMLHTVEQQAQVRDFWGEMSVELGWKDAVPAGVVTANPDVEYTVKITSMDEKIITVDENNVATAVGKGATTLVIEVLGKDGTVYDREVTYFFVEMDRTAPTDIAFEYDQYLLSLGNIGTRDTHAWAMLTPSETERFTEVRFESLDPNVVSINENGNINAVGAGKTTIKATAVYYVGEEEKTISDTATVYVADVKLTLDKEVYKPGDIATITLENLPTELEYDINWDFWHENCRVIEADGATLKVRVYQPSEQGFYRGRVYAHYQNWDVDCEIHVPTEGEWEEYTLQDMDVTAIPGEQVWIGPTFACSEIQSEIKDDSILCYIKDENGNDDICFFEMLATGETTVDFTCIAENGTEHKFTANVKVVEPEWTLWDMDNVPRVMYVGDEWVGIPNHSFNGYHGLGQYTTLAFSNPSVARAHEDDGMVIKAVAPGTCVVTATTELDGRIESMSKEIVVVEPVLYPAKTQIELRPGDQDWIEIIAGQGKEIEQLTYTSSNENAVTVDEEGNIKAIAGGEERVDAAVYVHAVFKDGTEAETVIEVSIIPDHEVYAWIQESSPEYTMITTDPWGVLESSCELWIKLNTNAADYEINYRWWSDDDTVVAIDEDMNNSSSTNMTVTALKEGKTSVYCEITVGEDGRFFRETVEFIVQVQPMTDFVPENAIRLGMEYDHLTMNCGEWTTVPMPIDLPFSEEEMHFEWVSTDHGIVWPSEDGEIRADRPGKANYLILAEREDQWYYGLVGIDVVEPWVEIDILEKEMTIPVGAVVYPNWEGYDSSDVGDPEYTYEWSDDSVIEVDEWGRIIAKAPGTSEFVVYAHNGAQAKGVITVHVYEPAVALNYYQLQAYTGLKYQLEVTSELPAGATVTFESEDESILTVTDEGLVVGVGEGDTGVVVTVTYADGTSDSSRCDISMMDFRFEFDNADPLNIVIGKTEKLWPGFWVSFYPPHQGLVEIVIDVEDESIVSYEKNVQNWWLDGRIATAHKIGTTNVTYTVTYKLPEVVEYPVVTATYVVNVVPPYLEAFLEESNWEEPIGFGRIGETHPLEFYWNGEERPEKQYFTSSDESVVTVSAEGVITPVGAGSATVTYHVWGYGVEHTASADVFVDMTEVSISHDEATLKPGESFYLLAHVDAPEGANANLNFISSNEKVVAVDGSNGLVTALKQGSAVIRIEGNLDGQWLHAECVVHVVNDAEPITFEEDMVYVRRGDTFALKPIFKGQATDIRFGTEDEERLPIDENGVVTVMDEWDNTNYAPSVWCEATVDGEPAIAYVTVRIGTPDVAIFGVQEEFWMSPKEETYFYYSVVTRTGEETYSIKVDSSDEDVVFYNEEDENLHAVSNGKAIITITAYGENDVVLARETSKIFVGVDPDAPEAIKFEYDAYFLSTPESGKCSSVYAQTYLVPDEANRYYGGDVVYSIDNEGIASIDDGGTIQAISAGETTIHATMKYQYNGEEKELTTSAKLIVGDISIRADKGNNTCDLFDLVTISIDLPENQTCDRIDWYFDNYELNNTEKACRRVEESDTSLTVRAYQPGDYMFKANVRVNDCWEEEYEIIIHVNGEATDRHLDAIDVRAAKGETVSVKPMFDFEDVVTVSSDPNIVVIDPEDPCRLTMVDVGEATITYTVKVAGEPDPVTLECYVVVSEAEWKLQEITDLPTVLYVGDAYRANMWYESNAFGGLHDYITLSVSDENVAKISKEDPFEVIALAPGKVTLTATMDFGGKIESISRDLYVVELAVRAEHEYVEWRPNTTHSMDIIVNDEREIESVQWTSGDANRICVNEDNTFTVLDTQGGGNNVRMNAVVTFKDQSTDTAMFIVRIVSDDEIYFEIREQSPGYIQLSTEPWGVIDSSCELWVEMDTNAAEHEISYQWWIEDENIVVFDEALKDVSTNRMPVTAVNAGGTRVFCTIAAPGRSRTCEFWIDVQPAYNNIPEDAIEWPLWCGDFITMNSGEVAELGFEQELPYDGEIGWEWRSTNDNVVWRDGDGFVHANEIGKANYALLAYCGEQVYCGLVGINVVEPWVEIKVLEEEMTIPVGSKIYPNWESYDSSDMSDPEYSYEWSDDSVIEVDEWGRIIAKAPGTSEFVVYAHNGAQAQGVITVHVYEPEVALNHYQIQAFVGLKYQLEVTSELPEGATVTFESEDESILTVTDEGLVVGVGEGDTGVVVTVTYADGTSDSSRCDISMIDFRFEFDNADPLNIGIGKTEKLWPGFWVSFYPPHQGLVEIVIDVEDESIVSYEKNVQNWWLDGRIATAHKIGTTNVTYTVTYKLPEVVEYPVVTATYVVNVVPPYLEAFLEESDWEEPIHFEEIGQTHDLRFRWEGEERPEKQYFTSSDEGVVTVSNEGVITAVGAGEATVTYHVWGYGVEHTKSANVLVECLKVTLSTNEVTRVAGESFYLLANVEAPEGANVNLNFTSSNENVVAVDGSVGLVTALKQGSAVIRVEGDVDGRWFHAECVVHVVDDAAPITFEEDVVYVRRGNTFELKPIFNGQATDIRFGTEDKERLPIDENGVVTVMDEWNNTNYAPSVWCEAMVDGEPAIAYVTVRVGDSAATIIGVRDEFWMQPEGREPFDYDVVAKNADEWYRLEIESSDKDVVVYNEADEHLYALSNGKAIITITAYGEDDVMLDRKTSKVFVGVGPDEPEAIKFEYDTYFLSTPESGKCSSVYAQAYFVPDEANRYYGGIVYSIDDDSIASIDDGGTIQAINAGETTIWATRMYEYNGEEKELTTSAKLIVGDISIRADKGNNTYDQFDLATVSIDLPENLTCEQISWENENNYTACRWVAEDDTSLTVRVYQPGDYMFKAFVRVNNYWEAQYEIVIHVDGEYTNRTLSDMDVSAVTGETGHVYPEFNYNTLTTVSSDPNIVAIDPADPCRLIMVGVGKATVTYTATVEGEVDPVTLVCNVDVSEPNWKLLEISNLPTALRLGETYSAYVRYGANAFWGLHDYITLSVSDETVAKISEDNPYDVIALAPGKFTLTATMDFGGKTESISRELYVIELAVHAEQEYVEWRPNTTHSMDIVVNDGHEIESVQWTSNDASRIRVNADNTFTVMDVPGGGNNVHLNAVITFTDGSMDTAMFQAYILPDWEVYARIDEYNQNLYLNVETWGNDPQQRTAYVRYHTNEAPKQVRVQWNNLNEDLFTISDQVDEQGYSSITVTAKAEGEGRLEVVVLGKDSRELERREVLVHVNQAWIELTPPRDEMTLNVGEHTYISFENHSDHCLTQTADVLVSSDPSVVTIDVHGNAIAVGSGTATITNKVYAGDVLLAQASMKINVQGEDIDILENVVELTVGDSVALTVDLFNMQDREYGMGWESMNPAVAMVQDGVVYAVGNGITYVQGSVDTDETHASDAVMVIVEGDNLPMFMIDCEEIELFGTQQKQLGYALSDAGAELGEPTNLSWSSSNEECVKVDENGLVTVEDRAETVYATITCTAELGGKTYTAYCGVKVNPRSLRINHFWVGEGKYQELNVGEEEEIWELIAVRGDVGYTIEYESNNEDVIVVDGRSVKAVGVGEANVIMTVTGDNGEVYTASRYYRVGMEPAVPESIRVYEKLRFVSLDDTDCSIGAQVLPYYAYSRLEYSGYDENVITVDEGGRINPINVGRTTVEIRVKDTDLTASMTIVVADFGAITLTSDDDDGVLELGQTVQLSLSGNVPWLPEDVAEMRYCNNDGGNLQLTQDGKLTSWFEYARDNIGVPLKIRFVNGNEFEAWYWFSSSVPEEYFFVLLEETREFIAWPGNGRKLNIRTNKEWESITYASSNTSVATVSEEGYVECTGIGEALITITAINGEETKTDTIKVIGRAAQPVKVSCDLEKQIIQVGETICVYVGHDYSLFTCPPEHEYVSGDVNILSSDGYQNEYGAFTVTGVNPGVTTLTVNANCGGHLTSDTVKIVVIPAENGEGTGDPEYESGEWNGFRYTPNDEETCTLIEYTGSETDIEIPTELDGYRVTHICDLALAGNEQLTSVVIPEGVKGIGAYVFQDCTALTSVSLPESVTDIGDELFDGCDNLVIVMVVPGSTAETWCNEHEIPCENE